MLQTMSQAKSSGVSLPEVHRVKKGIDLLVKPIENRTVIKKPRLGQGRAGLRRKIRLAIPPTYDKPVQAALVLEKQGSKIISQTGAVVGPETSSTQVEIDPILTIPKELLGPTVLTRNIPPY